MPKRAAWKYAFADWVDSSNPNHMEFFSALRPPRCLGRAFYKYDVDHPYWKDCSQCSFWHACDEIFLRHMAYFDPYPPTDEFDFEKNQGGYWRQAGGKYYARRLLADLVPPRVPCYSGFFGGGNVELILAGRGHSVRGYDKSFLVANLWQQALVHAKAMGDYIEINALGRMSPDLFRKLQDQLRQSPPPGFATACTTWLVNRCCRDGLLFAGYSTTKRLRRTAIQRLRTFNYPNVTVEQADFRDSLPANADRFKILDPPYMSANGSLYLDANQVDLHRGFPHVELADMLHHHDRWMLTYDDVAEVRSLYVGFRKTIDIQRTYTAGGRGRVSNELVIVSHDVDVPDTYEWVRD